MQFISLLIFFVVLNISSFAVIYDEMVIVLHLSVV